MAANIDFVEPGSASERDFAQPLECSHVIVCVFTFSEVNSRIVGQMLKAVSAFSIAADINIVMRFQPPSLDGIFHLSLLKQKLAAEFVALLGFVVYQLEPRSGVRHNRNDGNEFP